MFSLLEFYNEPLPHTESSYSFLYDIVFTVILEPKCQNMQKFQEFQEVIPKLIGTYHNLY